jgi:N-ethylmaleimide reductase
MSTLVQQSLLSPYRLGSLELPNRVVMASMTRGRARNAGLTPTQLHVEYYRQRASAGLIMTEGIWVSPRAIGFINVPGLFMPEQVAQWRKVTDAVHAEGGRIYAQLAHISSDRMRVASIGGRFPKRSSGRWPELSC